MAQRFRLAGLSAVAIWGDSPVEERRAALRDLASGRIPVVFTVDLFNEGVDVPNIDTLLLLRPTDSPTLFLQQLGRGLRKAGRQAGLHRARLRGSPPKGVSLRPSLSSLAWWITQGESRGRPNTGFPSCPLAAASSWMRLRRR